MVDVFRDVTGVVLAGGKSSRYGANKALAKIEGTPLIERATGVMKTLFKDVVLITNTPDLYAFLDLPMHEDLIKGLGPLGGIYTALSAIGGEAGFFVACDMPTLNPALIRHMVNARQGCDVVVPRISGNMETLHALYGRRCLPHIKALIDVGQYHVIRFFPEVSVRYVEEEETRRFDPQLTSFFNINRPQELRRVPRQ